MAPAVMTKDLTHAIVVGCHKGERRGSEDVQEGRPVERSRSDHWDLTVVVHFGNNNVTVKRNPQSGPPSGFSA